MIRKFLLILLVLSLGLLSGCGSDGDSISGSTADTTGDTGDTGTDTDTDTDTGTDSGGTTAPIVTTGTGDAVYATVTVTTNQIYVTGTGMNARAGINVKVYDNSGTLINDAGSGVNNVRVTMNTQPNGGEYLFGLNASGAFDSGSTIDVRTGGGSANLDLIAGTLPGPVEVSVEVLNDSGASFSTPLVITLPQVIIASGPPHTIAYSWPLTDAIEKLEGGLYRRIGSLTVTDRYGNAVPDGTAIHVGMMDSILAQDSDGATTAASANLTDSDNNIFSNDFTTSYVIRDGLVRMIQAGDRVLLPGAQYNDRSRHVSAVTNATTLAVQSAYNNTKANQDYLVGASLIGGYMTGINEVSGEMKTGVAVTKNGYARIYLYYPANVNTIHVGCTSVPDTRHQPVGSADVYVVASASNNRVTAISDDVCFSSIVPWSLKVKPEKLNKTGTVTLSLKDGGDEIPLPFVSIGSSVEITSAGDGLCSDLQYTDLASCVGGGETWSDNNFDITVTNCSTDTTGTCTATITVTGSTINSGDAAKITFYAGEAEASVTLTIP